MTTDDTTPVPDPAMHVAKGNEPPLVTPCQIRRDAFTRAGRTVWQGLLVTVLIGAATSVHTLIMSGNLLSFSTIATSALTGACMAVAAWFQRRLEARSARRD